MGRLASTAMVGTRVWLRQHRFRIALGPLRHDQFSSLLPGTPCFMRMTALVRSYIGDELKWDLQLKASDEAIRPAQLGSGAQLGRTSWLVAGSKRRKWEDLIVDISQTALSSGLANELFQPGPETPKEFYAEKPIALRMVGNYHQFGAFVSGVASLPRVVIMTMHDISLKPKNAKTDPNAKIGPNSALELAGTVKTYRYLDEEETAAQADAAKPAAPAKGGA